MYVCKRKKIIVFVVVVRGVDGGDGDGELLRKDTEGNGVFKEG